MFQIIADPMSLTNLVLLSVDLDHWIPELTCDDSTWHDYDLLVSQLNEVLDTEYWVTLKRDVDHGIPSIYD